MSLTCQLPEYMGHARTEWNIAAVDTETSFLIVHQTLNAELRDGFRDPYPIILKSLSWNEEGRGGSKQQLVSRHF